MSDNSSDLIKTNVRKSELSENESIDELNCFINKRIESKEVSISSNRIKLNISRGIWRSNERLVEVIVIKNINNFMGFTKNSVKYLNPFEALYLMECELIEINYKSIPLSIEESFQLFFQNINEFNFYRVYALLSRSGYFVKKHQKCENISQNDCDLDCNPFKRKLSLENNDSDYDLTKHLSIETNYYELSSKISNYKSMTNIRPLNEHLLPKSVAIQTPNKSTHDLSQEITTHLNDKEMQNKELNITFNKSIVYDIEDNETPLELDSSLILFDGNVKPLCSLGSILSDTELYDLIKSYGPKHRDTTETISSSNLDLMLDVYKADTKLDERPLFHVIVIEANQPLPQMKDIIYLKHNSKAKHFYFAVLDSGDVNFYSINKYELNDEFPVLWQKYLKPSPH